MTSPAPARRPKGQPTGGQFAPRSNPESDIELDWVPPDELVQEVGYAAVTEAIFTGSYGGLVGEDGYKADFDHRAFVLGLLATA